MGLQVMTADRDQALDLLNKDRTDLALGWLDEIPHHLNAELLLEEHPYCVMRPGHPLLGEGELRHSGRAVIPAHRGERDGRTLGHLRRPSRTTV